MRSPLCVRNSEELDLAEATQNAIALAQKHHRPYFIIRQSHGFGCYANLSTAPNHAYLFRYVSESGAWTDCEKFATR